jgi:LPS export ABC transporter protein LptC
MSGIWVCAALALALSVAAAGCGLDEPDEGPVEDDRPTRVVDRFHLVETRGGVLDWELNAREARTFEGESRLVEVELLFYRADGSLRSRLVSDRGLVLEKTGEMTALGNVVLVSVENDTLTTEEMHYLQEEDLITGPGPVRISKPDRVLTGIGFKAKPDLTEYEVHRDVHIELVDRDGAVDLER